MRKLLIGMIWLGMAGSAHGQDVSAAKAQADLDLVRANIEKARIDTDKARDDAFAAKLAPLKNLGGGTAQVNVPEKTAEALLLERLVVDRAAAALVKQLGSPAGGKIPVVVLGTTTPGVVAWRAFEQDRKNVAGALIAARSKWLDVEADRHKRDKGEKAVVPAAAFIPPALAIVGAIAPLLKTDTVITGAALSVEDAQLLAAIDRAIVNAHFAIDDWRLTNADGIAIADALLTVTIPEYGSSATAAYLSAKQTAADGAVSVVIADPDSSLIRKQAAQDLLDAIRAYANLRTSLVTPKEGVMPATLIDRERKIAEAPASYPLLYVLHREAALTSITKKNLFSGYRSTPATLTAALAIDYAVSTDGAKFTRGTLFCASGRVKFDQAMQDAAAANCTP